MIQPIASLDAMTGLLLPIIDNDLVLGVLDLQSRRVNAFPGDAARTLTGHYGQPAGYRYAKRDCL